MASVQFTSVTQSESKVSKNFEHYFTSMWDECFSFGYNIISSSLRIINVSYWNIGESPVFGKIKYNKCQIISPLLGDKCSTFRGGVARINFKLLHFLRLE